MQAFGSIAAILGAFFVARWQALSAERNRAAERKKAEVDLAEIAYILAQDAYACLDNIAGKFEKMQTDRCHKIGTERLEEILHAIRIYTAKNVPTPLYMNTVTLQREVAYTLTAVREQNRLKTISIDRVVNADKRSLAVLRAKDRIKKQWDILVRLANSPL